MATKTTPNVQLSFKPLMCPLCGDTRDNGDLSIYLSDLRTCVCSACDEPFDVFHTAEKFRTQATQWSALAAWVAAAGPILERVESDGDGKDGGA